VTDQDPRFLAGVGTDPVRKRVHPAGIGIDWLESQIERPLVIPTRDGES